MSLSPVIFSRIWRETALALVAVALNSASTTDPRATREYSIAIAAATTSCQISSNLSLSLSLSRIAIRNFLRELYVMRVGFECLMATVTFDQKRNFLLCELSLPAKNGKFVFLLVKFLFSVWF